MIRKIAPYVIVFSIFQTSLFTQPESLQKAICNFILHQDNKSPYPFDFFIELPPHHLTYILEKKKNKVLCIQSLDDFYKDEAALTTLISFMAEFQHFLEQLPDSVSRHHVNLYEALSKHSFDIMSHCIFLLHENINSILLKPYAMKSYDAFYKSHLDRFCKKITIEEVRKECLTLAKEKFAECIKREAFKGLLGYPQIVNQLHIPYATIQRFYNTYTNPQNV